MKNLVFGLCLTMILIKNRNNDGSRRVKTKIAIIKWTLANIMSPGNRMKGMVDDRGILTAPPFQGNLINGVTRSVASEKMR